MCYNKDIILFTRSLIQHELDQYPYFHDHIRGIYRSTHFHLCNIGRIYIYSSRGVVASAPDFERADEGSILTAGLCFKSGKSECNNSGYKLTGLTWWP